MGFAADVDGLCCCAIMVVHVLCTADVDALCTADVDALCTADVDALCTIASTIDSRQYYCRYPLQVNSAPVSREVNCRSYAMLSPSPPPVELAWKLTSMRLVLKSYTAMCRLPVCAIDTMSRTADSAVTAGGCMGDGRVWEGEGGCMGGCVRVYGRVCRRVYGRVYKKVVCSASSGAVLTIAVMPAE
jgi:hypothetical protein